MVAWPNWILHRRGQGTEESYATLDRWRLSHGVIVGMLALFAFSFVLAYAGMPNGEAVYATVGSLFEVCFLIQGAGSLSRLLKRWGWTGWKHNVVVALAVTVFSFGFVFYGCASALFGSQGVVTEYLRRRQNKNNSDR